MNPITTAFIILFVLASGTLRAQAEVPLEAVLRRAVLAEESEHNPRAAADLYRAVLAHGEAPASLRTEAAFRLGRCLQRLGAAEEARAAFELAAQGEGPVAQEAQEALEGKPGPAQIRLQVRVQQAMEMLLDPERQETGEAELKWMGQAAVPYLVAAVEGEQVDLHFVSRAVNALVAIGGEDVAAFMKRVQASPDALFKRAVVRGISGSGVEQEPVRSRLMAFLKDPDEDVRLEGLRRLKRELSREEVTALAQDSSARIRTEVLDALRVWIDPRQSSASEVFQLLAPAIVRGLEDDDAVVRAAAMGALVDWWLLPEGRDLFLEHIGRPDLANELRDLLERQGIRSAGHFQPVPSAERVFHAAEKLGSVAVAPSGADIADARQRHLGVFMGACLSSWDRSDLPSVLGLVELGYDFAGRTAGDLGKWVRERATGDDALLVARSFHRFRDPKAIARWFIDGRRPDAALLEPLKAWLEQRLEVAPAGAAEDTVVREVCRAINAIGQVVDAAYLQELAVRQRDFYGLVASCLSSRSDPGAVKALRSLLVLEADPSNAVPRNQIFLHLIRIPELSPVEIFPQAYELGLQTTSTNLGGQRPNLVEGRGLTWLATLVQGQSPGDSTPLTTYPADVQATLFDLCLRANPATAWDDVLQVVNRGQGGSRTGRATTVRGSLPRFGLEGRVYALLCQRALDCPRPELRPALVSGLLDRQGFEVLSGTPEEAARELATRALATQDPELTRAVLRSLRDRPGGSLIGQLEALLREDDASVVLEALRLLEFAGEEAVRPSLRGLLRHSQPLVRSAAAKALASAGSDQVLSDILPLLKDPDVGVRRSICRLCQELLQPEAIPALLLCLRDTSSGVRKAAEEALNAIHYYLEQHRRWEQLQGGAVPQASAAAEALIKQAGPENPKATRLAAIASLGTLGVPETLPLLITWMGDADAEIATAAQEAVERINR